MEWKPIETAPRKPGAKVDLWVVERRIVGCKHGKPGDTNGQRFVNAEWRHSFTEYAEGSALNQTAALPKSWGDGWVSHNRFVERPFDHGGYIATHWMPLPEPPEAG